VLTVAPDPALAEQAFVTEVARGMAALCGGEVFTEDENSGDLTIPLGLSAWIVRAAIGLPDAFDSLLRLRRAVLDVSGLDLRSEPVPLRVGDPRAALRSLGAYLFALVHRAAHHAGMTPLELAEATLQQLADGAPGEDAAVGHGTYGPRPISRHPAGPRRS